jgi:hypothetical protein
MNRRELLSGLAAAALAGGCTSQAPSWAQTSPARYGSPVPLPSPTVTGMIAAAAAGAATATEPPAAGDCLETSPFPKLLSGSISGAASSLS